MGVITGWHYPSRVENYRARNPGWSYLANILNNPQWEGHNGDTDTAEHPHANISIPAVSKTDYIRATEYGFAVPANARIDGIQALLIRSGGNVKDSSVILTQNAKWMSNKASWFKRADGNLIIQQYGSTTDKWGANNITPTILNDPDGLGILVELYNDSTSSNSAWVHVIGLRASYTNPTYSLTSNLREIAVLNSQINYQIVLTATNGVDQGVPIPVNVPIPSNLTLVSATSSEGTYDATTHTWTPKLNSSHKATLDIVAAATATGSQSQTVTETEFNTTITNSCNVVETDSGNITVTEAVISDSATLENLVDGETYTISAYNKLTDANLSTIFGGVRNNRICVVNGEETEGTRVTAQNVYTPRQSVTFQYDSSQTLTLRLYGQYQSVSTTEHDEWRGFALKQGYDISYEPAGNLLVNPDALLSNATTSIVTLPAGASSTKYDYKFDNIPQPGSADTFFRGIMVTLDVTDRINSGITLQLKSSSGNDSNILSKNFDSENTQIIFGGDLDLWGLSSDDLIDQELTLEVRFNNISASQITPAYSNINLILYWMEDVTGGAEGITYNGAHSRNYGVVVYDIDNPEGADSDITTITLTGFDGELVTNQTIKAKEIPISFRVFGDTLEDAQIALREVNKWLQNSRNGLGKPIPNDLILDWDPTRRYQAILKGSIDPTLKITTFECKATFLIPSGVALNVDPTVTGATGTNEGVTEVRPIITVITGGSSSISITDTLTTSELIIINETITSGTVLTIDCENRTVKDSNGTDYTTDVGINSVWFSFQDDYDLECVGGIIQSVSYYETY